MKAPDRIYMPNELLSEDWQRHIEGEDTCYIRKDALLEWAKEREAETRDKAGTDAVACAYHDAIMDLIEKIESL